MACDLPSGVDADTGEVEGEAVRADVTVTFGTYKPGLLVDPGAGHAGVVELVDIGLAPYLDDPDACVAQAEDVDAWLPVPSRESDKYRRGVTGVLAGSETFTGAAVLSVGGAVRGGAGMVRFASSAHAVEVVRQRWPEAVTTVVDDSVDGVGRVQAWVVGPGLGTGERAESLISEVLGGDLPVLVDADGLTVLARRRDLLRRDAPTLLTPHAGELARLLGTDAADGGGPPAGARTAGRRGAGRDRAAQGLHHGRRRARPAGPRQPRPEPPGSPPRAAATCCPASPARCWRAA